MDIDSATTANLNAIAVADADTNTSAPKSPDPDTQTPTRIQQLSKPLSFTNGVLKRHHHHRHAPAPAPATTYKECLKNHAAAMGGHALDGCGEFMPSPNATASNPTSLKCAACGCHRNFHRRDPEPFPPPLAAAATIEYQPHHRHHPPPPLSQRSPNSASPPPISSSYYPSAPHMLLALSGAGPAPGLNENHAMHVSQGGSSATRKRFRTKFSQSQKERMYEFAERVGWKIQKRDEDLVREFCGSVGIDKGVLKVWMHNNKNTLGKNKDANGGSGRVGNDVDDGENANHPHHHRHFENDNSALGGTNGSSSSS